jgi:hypothetical protein
MPQHALHGFDVRAGRDGQARGGVAQLVRREPLEADLGGVVVEPPVAEGVVAQPGLRAAAVEDGVVAAAAAVCTRSASTRKAGIGMERCS